MEVDSDKQNQIIEKPKTDRLSKTKAIQDSPARVTRSTRSSNRKAGNNGKSELIPQQV